MKKNRTLYERLTHRYFIIVRDEETFEEKITLNLSPAMIFGAGAILFFLTVALSFLAVTTVLSRQFNPNYRESAKLKRLLDLASKIDSLENEITTRDMYLAKLRNILEGKPELPSTPPSKRESKIANPSAVNLDKSRPIDSAFRREFEGSEEQSVMSNRNAARADFESLFLFTPLDGVVTNEFNIKKNHYGIDIVGKTDEPVRCVADGTVIFSSWTQDGGLVIAVQHKSQLVSIYKHNSQLYNKVGDIVKAGDIIGIIGNSGEQTDGPHLHFEIWLDGNPVDPKEFLFLQ